MITSDGKNIIYNNIINNILKGQVLISGKYVDLNIHKTEITSTSVKVFLYLDETLTGQVTNYRLISTSGKVFLEKGENFAKSGERGLLVLFEILVQEG